VDFNIDSSGVKNLDFWNHIIYGVTAKTELERSLKMCIINKYKAQTTLFNIQVK